MMGRAPGLQRPQTAAQKAILDKNGKKVLTRHEDSRRRLPAIRGGLV